MNRPTEIWLVKNIDGHIYIPYPGSMGIGSKAAAINMVNAYRGKCEVVKAVLVYDDEIKEIEDKAVQNFEELEERLSRLEDRFQNTLDVNCLWDGS